MKILFLNPSATIGGAERVLLQMIVALRKSDPNVSINLVAFEDGPLLEEARELGANAQALPLPARLARMGDSGFRDAGRMLRFLKLFLSSIAATPAAIIFLWRLRRKIAREICPDIIHSNGIKTHLLTRLAGHGKIPVVWHIQDLIGLRPVAAKLLRAARRGVAAAVAISDAVKRDAEPFLKGIPIYTIRNAVDLEKFSPAAVPATLSAEAAASLNAASGVLRVGLVATFARWKGQALFLEAARLVAQANPAPIRFFIIGGPIYSTPNQFSLVELKELAEKLGVAERVAFIPFQKDVAAIYRALDIVVHASTLPEPFGLSIAEAMSSGRAVIVSDAGGASELFTHGHDALGVPPNDLRALADAILRLAENENLRRELGKNARKTAEVKFNPEHTGTELLKLYRAILE